MGVTGASLVVCEAQCVFSPWSPWSVFQHVLLTVSSALTRRGLCSSLSASGLSHLSCGKSRSPGSRQVPGEGSGVGLWGLGSQRLRGELSSGPLRAEMSAETLEEGGSSLAAVYTLLGLNPNHTGFFYMVSWQLTDQIWLKRNGSAR